MKYNTVVFDLDGTLLDTLEDLMDALNYALERYGHPIRTLEEVRSFVGNGARRLIERALPEGGSISIPDRSAEIEKILPAFQEYYSAHCEEKTCVYDGAAELIKRLNASGFKLAIVSNKPDSAVKTLNQSYFSGYVHTAAGEKEGIRRKPAPDMVENALKELGSSKSEAVYVGDSEVDIQTAANAGLACISVTWGFRSADFLKENGAAVLAHSPKEVYDLICGQADAGKES